MIQRSLDIKTQIYAKMRCARASVGRLLDTIEELQKISGIGSSNFKFFSQSEITSFDQIILFKSTVVEYIYYVGWFSLSHVDSWWSDLLIGLGSDKPSYVMSGCKVDFQTVDVVTFHRCDIGNL